MALSPYWKFEHIPFPNSTTGERCTVHFYEPQLMRAERLEDEDGITAAFPGQIDALVEIPCGPGRPGQAVRIVFEDVELSYHRDIDEPLFTGWSELQNTARGFVLMPPAMRAFVCEELAAELERLYPNPFQDEQDAPRARPRP